MQRKRDLQNLVWAARLSVFSCNRHVCFWSKSRFFLPLILDEGSVQVLLKKKTDRNSVNEINIMLVLLSVAYSLAISINHHL